VGTIYSLYYDVSDASWMTFWKYFIYINILMSLITIVWFTWGGFRDLNSMMKKLRSSERDHGDDGWVTS
jgi:hypothetical protein